MARRESRVTCTSQGDTSRVGEHNIGVCAVRHIVHTSHTGVGTQRSVDGVITISIGQVIIQHSRSCALHTVLGARTQTQDFLQHILTVDSGGGVVDGCSQSRAETVQGESSQSNVLTNHSHRHTCSNRGGVGHRSLHIESRGDFSGAVAENILRRSIHIESDLGSVGCNGVERGVGLGECTLHNGILGAGLEDTVIEDGEFLNVGAHLYLWLRKIIRGHNYF
jgi:hypothetical protein